MDGSYVDSSFLHKIKVIFLGAAGVGKTAIITRFVDNYWVDRAVPTIGVDFTGRTINVDGRPVRIQIWDTAGQERFHSLIPSYLREARGAIVVYDVTNRGSFDEGLLKALLVQSPKFFSYLSFELTLTDLASRNLCHCVLVQRWVSEVRKYRDDEVEVLIVGNKTDRDGREVPLEEARSSYAGSGLTVIETSARTGYNVKMVFETMARKVQESPTVVDEPLSESVLLTAEEVPLQNTDCSC